MGEYIEISTDMIQKHYELSDYFTPAAIELLMMSEFELIVRVESDRILTCDYDLCGQWIDYDGEKIPAECIGSLLKNPEFVLPESFQAVIHLPEVEQFNFEYLPGAFYYAGNDIEGVVDTLKRLTGEEIEYDSYDNAFVIFV